MGQERKERRRVGENSGLRGFFGGVGFLDEAKAGMKGVYPTKTRRGRPPCLPFLFCAALLVLCCPSCSVLLVLCLPFLFCASCSVPALPSQSKRAHTGVCPYSCGYSGPRTTIRLPWTMTTCTRVPIAMNSPSVTTDSRTSSISTVPDGRSSVTAVPN